MEVIKKEETSHHPKAVWQPHLTEHNALPKAAQGAPKTLYGMVGGWFWTTQFFRIPPLASSVASIASSTTREELRENVGNAVKNAKDTLNSKLRQGIRVIRFRGGAEQ